MRKVRFPWLSLGAVLVAAFGLFISVGIALAGGNPARRAPTQDEVQRARALFQRGRVFFSKGKYVEAANAFEDAYALHKHKAIEYNLAVTHALLGHVKRAVTYFRAFLRHESNPPPLPDVLKKAQSRVGAVVVSVKNPDAIIYVNGRPAGKGHVDVVVDPGRVVLEVRLRDRVVAHKELTVLAGRETVYEFAEIKPEHVGGTGPGGAVGPGGSGGAVGGGQRGGESRGASYQTLHWAYFATATAVALGLAAGAVATGVMAKKDYDDFQKDRSNEALRDEGVKLVKITNGLWGAAGGMAAAAVVLAIFTRWKGKEKQEKATSVTAVPMITPGGGGLVITIRR